MMWRWRCGERPLSHDRERNPLSPALWAGSFTYGGPIGIAMQDVRIGQHVHVHNLESARPRRTHERGGIGSRDATGKADRAARWQADSQAPLAPTSQLVWLQRITRFFGLD